MTNYEEESVNTQTEEESEETQTEEGTEKTPEEPSLTKEQKSKLDSFDRIYAENKELKSKFKVPETPVKEDSPKQEPDLDKLVEEKLNERDLASMDLSDNLKSEVKTYAKAKGVSYREVLKSPYFNFIKEQEDAKTRSEEASASSSSKTTKSKQDFGNLKDEDIKNLSDEEFEQYKGWLKSQG